MKHTLFILAVLAGTGYARPFAAVAADPNECIPVVYGPPTWADPNIIGTARVLAWNVVADANDPNEWYQVMAGKRERVGTWCDPDGNPITVECHNVDFSVVVDPNGLWTLSGEVKPGANYVHLSVTDQPQFVEQAITVEYCVCIWGLLPPNRGPVLY